MFTKCVSLGILVVSIQSVSKINIEYIHWSIDTDWEVENTKDRERWEKVHLTSTPYRQSTHKQLTEAKLLRITVLMCSASVSTSLSTFQLITNIKQSPTEWAEHVSRRGQFRVRAFRPHGKFATFDTFSYAFKFWSIRICGVLLLSSMQIRVCIIL